jgi:hypothetical protein
MTFRFLTLCADSHVGSNSLADQTRLMKSVSRAPEIDTRIRTIRGVSVILDSDLAELYGVGTRTLLQAVRRNRKRFPPDFMFQLTDQDLTNLRSQSVTSSLAPGYGGRRYLPWVFTEQGVAMVSSVLRRVTAISVNIDIMRAFVRLRRAALASSRLLALIDDLSKRVDSHDAAISDIVESIRQLVEPPAKRSRPIGFTADVK